MALTAARLAGFVTLAAVGFGLGHVAASNKPATTATVTASKVATAPPARPAVRAVNVGLVVPRLVVIRHHRSHAATSSNPQPVPAASSTGSTQSFVSPQPTPQPNTTAGTPTTTTKTSPRKVEPLKPQPFSTHTATSGSSTGDSGSQ